MSHLKSVSPDAWSLAQLRALPSNNISTLASPSLTPTCGHSSFFTVTRVAPEGGAATVICEACFHAVRDSDTAARRAANPIIADACFSCGGGRGVRMNVDLDMPMCDACVDRSREKERTIEMTRTVPQDVVPDEVVPGVLFIGAKEAAANPATLARLGITRVLVCCDSLRNYCAPSAALLYHRLPIADSLAQGLAGYLPNALAFIAQGALKGERTLVHCNAGVSRSGSVIVEWLRRTAAISVTDAWAAAKAARALIRPNSNFLRQLEELPSPVAVTDAPPPAHGEAMSDHTSSGASDPVGVPATPGAHTPGFTIPGFVGGAGVVLGRMVFGKGRAPGKAAIFEGPLWPSSRTGSFAGTSVTTLIKVVSLRHEPEFETEVRLQRLASTIDSPGGRGPLSPAVLAIYYAGPFAYIVMERVDGMSIADEFGDEASWSKGFGKPGTEHEELAAEVRAAVAALARAGIKYVDRTPYNFMCGIIGGVGSRHVCVIDFGFARSAAPEVAAKEASGALWNADMR